MREKNDCKKTGQLEATADWLASEIGRSAETPTYLVGYSMGATIALAAASRHPGIADRIALVAGTLSWGGGARSLAAKFPLLSARFLRARAVGELSTALSDEGDRQIVRDMFAKADLPTMGALLAETLRSDFRSLAEGVRCPVLIVSGGDDPLAGPARAEADRKAFHFARHVEIPGARHYLCLTHADIVTDLLLAFGNGEMDNNADKR